MLATPTASETVATDRSREIGGLATANHPTVFTSTELLQGRREAWIEHGDQLYRLRLTHAGKLYLTK